MLERLRRWTNAPLPALVRSSVRISVRTLLPCSCALCGELADEVVCAPCRQRYAAPRGPRCRCCANPLGASEAAGQLCGACLAGRPAFDATVAATDYAPPLDALVLGLKFGARRRAANVCCAHHANLRVIAFGGAAHFHRLHLLFRLGRLGRLGLALGGRAAGLRGRFLRMQGEGGGQQCGQQGQADRGLDIHIRETIL